LHNVINVEKSFDQSYKIYFFTVQLGEIIAEVTSPTSCKTDDYIPAGKPWRKVLVVLFRNPQCTNHRGRNIQELKTSPSIM
jgi:hypothetical protein